LKQYQNNDKVSFTIFDASTGGELYFSGFQDSVANRPIYEQENSFFTILFGQRENKQGSPDIFPRQPGADYKKSMEKFLENVFVDGNYIKVQYHIVVGDSLSDEKADIITLSGFNFQHDFGDGGDIEYHVYCYKGEDSYISNGVWNQTHICNPVHR